MRVRFVILAGLGLGLAGAPAPTAAAWRPPVPGPVVAGYAHVRGSFAPGERRGARFAAAPGAAVHAPCGGRVTWAGSVGAVGPGVAVRCGATGSTPALSATVTGLGAVAVRRGAAVPRGAVVGRAGAAGWVQLGARDPAVRDGYRDPLALMGRAERPPLPAWRRAPRGGRPPVGAVPPRRAPVPVAARARPVAAPRPATWPIALGGSLALVCALLGGARRYAGAYRLRRVRRKAPVLAPSRSARE